MKNHRKTKRLHYGLAGVLLAMLVALGMVRNEHSDTAQASGGQQLTVHYIDVSVGSRKAASISSISSSLFSTKPCMP